ncbi:MAG: DUF5678 domain-containing protein [Thermodesulfobacteriota bacterium]
MRISEEFIGNLRKTIDSVPTGANSPEEILAHLDRIGMECYVTEKCDLGVKYWQIFPGFVSEEHAAVIRAERPSPFEGSRIDWLSDNLQLIQERYAGQWIAIGDNEIVASAFTLPDLLTLISDINNPFVTFIPAEELTWTFVYDIQEF